MPSQGHGNKNQRRAELESRLRQASGSREELSKVLYDHAPEVLFALIENPRLEETQALVLLSRKDLTWKVLEQFSQRHDLLRSYRIKLALVRHPHSPRAVSVPLMRHLFLFDLIKVTITPGVPADVRRMVEEQVAMRAPTLPLGQRISLARQGARLVLAALLQDKETIVLRAVLNNPGMTEDLIARGLGYEATTAEAVEMVAGHARWSKSYNLKLALLRHPQTSLARVLTMAEQVLVKDLQTILDDPRMPASRRAYLSRWAAKRAKSVRGESG